MYEVTGSVQPLQHLHVSRYLCTISCGFHFLVIENNGLELHEMHYFFFFYISTCVYHFGFDRSLVLEAYLAGKRWRPLCQSGKYN